MHEHSQQVEVAILVHIDMPGKGGQEALEEFKELTRAAGVLPKIIVTGTRFAPDPKFYVGSGKAAEILAHLQTSNAKLVLFNHSLSPAQERNLEKYFECRVLDRTELILDIFAQRARTFEGKLQVELAQLQHLASRLVRGWTHLERQRGGIGLRGPGETQLETDRRLIRKRIKTITQRLEKVKQHRAQGRRARQKSHLPTVSIVGYTNAGKSTLFNRLTNSEVFVADQPFATLDPTLRRLDLSNGISAVIADTVGFIRELPHDLIEAFHATLEETQLADLLVHVVDAHLPQHAERITEVNNVLEEIDAQNIPQLLVYNKIDLTTDQIPRIERALGGKPWRVWLSASQNLGIDLLQQALMELLETDMVCKQIRLTHDLANLRAKLYALNAVESEIIDEEGCWLLQVRLPKNEYNKLFFPVLLS